MSGCPSLDAAGHDDIPKNGLYVIGGLARETGAHPLSELIEELRLSKQAAGQLVDTLVTRGYLKRDVDSEDRRRLTIALTARGRAAAKVLSAHYRASWTLIPAERGRAVWPDRGHFGR
jgi:DNA-binding MarR family transcriptional regulator